MTESATTTPIPIAVAVSGGGRTLKNLWQQQFGKAYRIAAVISSRPDCLANAFATEKGLPIFIGAFSTQADPNLLGPLTAFLQQHRVGLIALAGFLRPFPVLPGFEKRIVNIHPALLPRFGGKGMYGMHVHEAVLKAGEQHSGASVHYVSEHYDEGTIIAQCQVAIDDLSDPESIAARVFGAECRLYPEVLDKLCCGQLPRADQSIYIMKESEHDSLTSPER
jgi:phosphoribosylglycinamide formyltransferase-1